MSSSRSGTKLFVPFVALGGALLLAHPFRRERPVSVRVAPRTAGHVVLRETPVPGAVDAVRPDAPTAEIQPTLLAPPPDAAEPHPIPEEVPRLAPPPTMARSYPNLTTYGHDPAIPFDSGRQRSIQRIHKVRDGDTLEDLAQRYLGDRTRWREIFEANRDQIQQPEPLPLAARLVIPPRLPHTASESLEESRSKVVSRAPLVPLVP